MSTIKQYCHENKGKNVNKTTVLYSTGCPKCSVLKKKLEQAHVEFKIETDVGRMTELGISSVPVLEVDGNLLDFGKAIEWINTQIS